MDNHNDPARPVRSDGNTRRASYSWLEDHMGGRIEIHVTAEFAFEDEEPHITESVARTLREHATRLDGNPTATLVEDQ